MHRPQGRSCPAVQAKPRTAASRFVGYRLKHFFVSNTCHSTATRGRNSRSLKRRNSTRASPIVFTRTRGASNGGASRFFFTPKPGGNPCSGSCERTARKIFHLAVGGPGPGIRPAWVAPLIPSTLTEARRWSRYDLPR